MAANGNKKLVVCPITIQEGWDEIANEQKCAIAESMKAIGLTGVKVQKGGIITWKDFEGTKRQAFNQEAREFIEKFDNCIDVDDDGKFVVKPSAELPNDKWTMVIRERDVIKVLETPEQRATKRAQRAKKQRQTGTRTVTTQVVGGTKAAQTRATQVTIKQQTTPKPKTPRKPRSDGRMMSIGQ